mgnify:CR=1 FL=1
MLKIKLLSRWDDNQKATAIKILGAVIGFLAVYALFASLSYVFTWKQDQSLLTAQGSMSPLVDGHNAAGKLGHRLGHLLMCRWFGLGSLALLVIPVAIAIRLLLGGWKWSLLKTSVVSISGAALCSSLLSFVARLFGSDTALGGGLGGRFGSFVNIWCDNLCGKTVTLVILLLLSFCWLLFSWPGFIGKLRESFASKQERPAKEPRKSKTTEKEPVPASVKPVAAAPSPLAMSVSAEPHKVEEASAPEAPAETPETAAEPASEGSLTIDRDESISAEIKEPLPRIEPRLEDIPDYKFPTLDILDKHSFGLRDVPKEELERNNNKIRVALGNYRIQVDDVKAKVGPTVTLYKLYLAKGVKIAEVKKLQEDLAINLNAKGVRVVVLEDSVGIEVANDVPSIVPLRAMLNDDAFRNSKADLPVAIGYTIQQKVKVFDLADTPHLLVAGATKQGKSVGLNTIVASLLFSKHPSELKFVFIDPKMVEFSAYKDLLHHYLAVLPDAGDEEEEKEKAIVKSPKNAERVLRSLCMEMDERYLLLSKAGVNNLGLYNDKYQDRHLLPTDGHRYLPYIVVIVDEYADLTLSSGASPEVKAASKSIQNSIIRLAQKGRAAGIHVIIATQRPSVDVISGIIKANFPTRIAFRVISRVDSNTILDSPGAEKLIGKGDMIYYSGVENERVQCAFISNDEILRITKYIGAQQGYRKSYNTPYYLPDPTPAEEGGGIGDVKDLDERFEDAAKLVVTTQKGSTSDLQRRLSVGYAKAGRIMDQLEAAGIVGPQDGSKPRQVLIHSFEELDELLQGLGNR